MKTVNPASFLPVSIFVLALDAAPALASPEDSLKPTKEAAVASTEKPNDFKGFSSYWTAHPTDLLDLPAAPRIEVGGDATRSTAKIKSDNFNVDAKMKADTIKATPSASLLDGQLFFSLGVEKSWKKIQFSGSTSAPDTELDQESSVTATARQSFVNPQVAFKVNDMLGLGLGYEHYREEFNATDLPALDLNYGRFHLSSRLSSGPVTVDVGVKNKVIASSKASKVTDTTNNVTTTESREEYRNLPTEVSGKVNYAINSDLDMGMMLKFFDYDRKSNKDDDYKEVKLKEADRMSLAFQTSYRPLSQLSLQGIIKHEAVAESTKPGQGFISTNGVEINTIVHPMKNVDIGLQLGYAQGKDKMEFDSSETAEANGHPKLAQTKQNIGLWVASSF